MEEPKPIDGGRANTFEVVMDARKRTVEVKRPKEKKPPSGGEGPERGGEK